MAARKYVFNVDGLPIRQPRQRHTARIINGRAIATNYTPSDDPVNTYKACIKMKAVEEVKVPFTDAVLVQLEFYFPRPESHFKKDGTLRKGKPKHFTNAPDCDNLAKAVCDALNGIAWKDDRQVVSLRVNKEYLHPKEIPFTSITIMEIN